MKIEQLSGIKLDVLKYALLINPNGAEYRISHFETYLEDLNDIHVVIYDEGGSTRSDGVVSVSSLSWESLKDWSIQLDNEPNFDQFNKIRVEQYQLKRDQ